VNRPSDSSGLNSGSNGSSASIEAAIPAKFAVVLMTNILEVTDEVHLKFDFKGSQLGRETLDPRLSLEQQVPSLFETSKIDLNRNFSNVLLKEMDFHRLVTLGELHKLRLDEHTKQLVFEQLQLDVNFLQARNLIDYRYAMTFGAPQRKI
jgi:hypothetical protein